MTSFGIFWGAKSVTANSATGRQFPPSPRNGYRLANSPFTTTAQPLSPTLRTTYQKPTSPKVSSSAILVAKCRPSPNIFQCKYLPKKL